MAAAALAVDGAEELASLALVVERDLAARERLAERNRLAIGPRPARAPGEAHIERFEKVRLARAVGPMEERHPLPQLDLARDEIPEAERVEQDDPHRVSPLDVQPDGHHEVGEVLVAHGAQQS